MTSFRKRARAAGRGARGKKGKTPKQPFLARWTLDGERSRPLPLFDLHSRAEDGDTGALARARERKSETKPLSSLGLLGRALKEIDRPEQPLPSRQPERLLLILPLGPPDFRHLPAIEHLRDPFLPAVDDGRIGIGIGRARDQVFPFVALDLCRAPIGSLFCLFKPGPADDAGPFGVSEGVERVPEGCLACGAVGGEEPDAAGACAAFGWGLVEVKERERERGREVRERERVEEEGERKRLNSRSLL